MTWRDELRRVTIGGKQLIGASFRGVPFLVEGDDLSAGRRAVVVTMPFRQQFVDDEQGALPRTFGFSAYLVGDDYIAQRDALLDACEAEGPGELRHHQYGIRSAVCLTATFSHTVTELGMCRVTLSFADAPAQSPVPVVEADPAGAVSAAADEALAASSESLTESYSAAGLPSFALESASEAIASAAAALGAALSPLATTAQELAELGGRIRTITDEADALARTPGDAVDELRAAIVGMAGAVRDTPGALSAAIAATYLADLGITVIGSTSTRERERVNQAALIGAIRRMLASESARVLPLATFESIEQATAARDLVAGQLEEQIELADDTAYGALVMLRAELMRQVPGAAVFAREITIERRTDVPSLLLTYQLYGSVDNEADVIDRNGVRHPGFMAGTFKVLSDG